jgi:hypothetical protein
MRGILGVNVVDVVQRNILAAYQKGPHRVVARFVAWLFNAAALRGLAFVMPFARPGEMPLALAAVIPAAWRSRVCCSSIWGVRTNCAHVQPT